MMKIGIRNNLFYPISALIYLFLRRIVEILLIPLIIEDAGTFFYPLLIFASQFTFGLLAKYLFTRNRRVNKIAKVMGISLIQSKNKIKIKDKFIKVTILKIFSSYFNFANVMIKKLGISSTSIESKILQNNIRSFQIIIAAILCYFTIRTNIYKHHLLSLIIISISLILVMINEIIFPIEKEEVIYETFLYSSFAGFSKAFMDTIDKYLIEYDYINHYNIIIFEGIFAFILTILLILFDQNRFLDDIEKFNNCSSIIGLVILFIIFFILSGMTNIYRILTLIFFSPMTRSLSECFLDPIIFIGAIFWVDLEKNENIWYIIFINLFFTLVISFFTCIYNEFLVIYCCGMEFNTHLEIEERARIILYDDGNVNDSMIDIYSDEDK